MGVMGSRRALLGRALPVPSLDLTFTAGQFDPRLSFSRSSLAWQFDSAGTLVTAPHNLLTNSQDLDAAAWTKNEATVTANAATAPDGTTTADLLVPGVNNVATHAVRQDAAVSSGVTVTVSVHLKAAGYSHALFRCGNIGETVAFQVAVDMTNGTLGTPSAYGAGGSASGAVISPVGDGWYRVSLTGALAAVATYRCVVYGHNAAGAPAFAGDGTSGILVWGAQLEQHGSARAYQNTSVRNLLGYSEDLSNAAWTKTGGTISANAVTAPDGMTTADLIVENSATSVHGVYQSVTKAAAAAITYTLSAHVKAATRSQVRMLLEGSSSGNASVYFDLAAGTKGTASVSGGFASPTATITAIGSGWYRCSLTATTNADTGVFGDVYMAVATNSSYTGDGTSGLHLWGAQLSSSGSLDAYSPNAAAAPSSAAYHGPRLDYDPAAAVVRRNLLTYSEQLDNAAWVKFGTVSVTANTVAAPDGTATADQIAFTTASAGTYQAVGGTASTTYTFSVWLRAASSTPCRVVINTNLSDPVISTVTVTTEWQRFTVSKTTAAGTTTVNSQLQDSGSGGTTVFAWGAQLETGSAATAYVASTVVPGVAADVQASPRGLLIEEARTNLLLRSAEFDHAAWVKLEATVSANAAVAPDGMTTADKLVESAAAAVRALYQAATVAAGATMTFSVFVKAAGRTVVQLVYDNGSTDGCLANFDLSAGTTPGAVAKSAGTAVGASISALGGGWYRCSVTGSFPTTTAARCALTPVLTTAASAFPSYAGDGSSGLLLFGAQLEAGAFATSLVPTVASTATRAADNCSMPVGSWYSGAEGTLYAEFQTAASGNNFAVQISDNTYNNRILVGFDATSFVGQAISGGSATLAPSSRPVRTTAVAKAAFGWATNDGQIASNGVLATADTSGAVPTGLTRVDLGSDHGGANRLTGWLRSVRYYPRRLPDATLQAITA